MPWSVNNTIPAMQNKSKELRELFAEVANKSLSSGKDEQSAIFAGLAAVKLAERKNKPAKIEKTSDLPEHLRLVLHAKELIKSSEFEVNKAVGTTETKDVSITSLNVKDNSLLIIYSDGTKKKIELPSQTINTSAVIDSSLSPKPYIDLIPEPGVVDYSEARLVWNNLEHTLDLHTGVDNVVLQLGQEQYIRVRNSTGLSINNAQVVYISGAQGNRPKVSLAYNTNAHIAQETIGLATHNISNNSEGFICTSGLVRDVNTSAFSEGDTLYLGAVAGSITNVKPLSPNAIVRVGTCVSSHVTQGIILVNISVQSVVETGGGGGSSLVQYQYALSGLLQSITNETGRAFPRVAIYNANGDEVLVSNRLFNGSIIIESNIDMTGLLAVIE